MSHIAFLFHFPSSGTAYFSQPSQLPVYLPMCREPRKARLSPTCLATHLAPFE